MSAPPADGTMRRTTPTMSLFPDASGLFHSGVPTNVDCVNSPLLGLLCSAGPCGEMCLVGVRRPIHRHDPVRPRLRVPRRDGWGVAAVRRALGS